MSCRRFSRIKWFLSLKSIGDTGDAGVCEIKRVNPGHRIWMMRGLKARGTRADMG